ncbi:hypothetical protein [Stappia sp. P2PMeth1]|uniref:hypothetical protein n=1 Tax=Stappia sp. P2PMeth1 TaxID=2003586 RepID=UPI0016474DD6|nr:hypothetical protein [Stappia sp. P2PMeth1]
MAKQLTRSAVRIYGALTALGNGSSNVMESLLPFFDPILRQLNGSKLDPNHVAELIRSTYRWNFNADVVEAFAPYLAKQGWVHADLPGNTDTTYTICIGDEDLEPLEAGTIEQSLKDIATEFKKFSEELSPLTSIPREVEEFEDILVEWLLYVEAFSEKSAELSSDVRVDEDGKIIQRIEFFRETSLRDEEHFLCARFVRHIIEKDDGRTEILSRIAAIGLLTEVVQDFVSPVEPVDRTNLVVYLDAPVAMELLGLSGKAAYSNTLPIVSELIEMGASVRIFGQSVDEIKYNLSAVLKNPRPTGPTAQAILKREVLKEYVIAVAQNPVPFLERLNVKVTYRDLKQTPSDHKYFTQENWREIYSKIKYTENNYAREHDADIVSLVVRQRSGGLSQDIFKSHAIILTRNGVLTQIVRRFLRELRPESESCVPPVVHRRALATAMWLRTGMGATDLNIPRRMLLASCERVLAIRPNVVDAVKKMTDAMGDETRAQQLDLLISQDRSVQALMDKTLGLANVVTEENFPLLWQEMLHPHLEQEREKAQAILQNQKKEEKARISEMRKKLQASEESRLGQQAAFQEKLSDSLRQDRIVVVRLCDDVFKILKRRIVIRKLFGLFFAVVFTIPVFFESVGFLRYCIFAFGLLLSYLTITGGRLVSVSIEQDDAIKLLKIIAEKRGLSAKVQQFQISWMKNGFQVSETEVFGDARSSDGSLDLGV